MTSKPAPAARPRKNPGKLGLLGILGIGAFFPASTLLMIGGMAPTALVWLTDRSPGKLISITVGSINLAVMAPLLVQLWDRGNTLSIAVGILLSPFSWILVLGGACIGWVFSQTVPLLIVGMISGRDKIRLERIRNRQKAIVEEWGPAVTELPDPSSSRR